jgi:hypothetical protein
MVNYIYTGIIKEFIRWMSLSLQGRLSDYIAKKTINVYVFGFFALWARYAVKVVPKEMRLQIMAYLHSPELSAIAPLTTKMRDKPIADSIDVEILIRGIWQNKTHFRTNRMRGQIVYTILLSAFSSERPGAVVESSGYRHSNEALEWGDHDFLIVPNPRNPRRPIIVAIVGIRLLKGQRKNESFSKFFFLVMEPDCNRAICPMTTLLYLALEDDIFVDVHTIEDIMYPEYPPTAIHVLAIKPHMKRQPVVRAEVKTESGWGISPKLALPYVIYASHLRTISLVEGFTGMYYPQFSTIHDLIDLF